MRFRKSLSFVLLCFLVHRNLAGPCFASNSQLCGLHSVHAALHAIDIEARFEDLVKPENLSSPHGSTAKDLMRIAQEHGAFARYRKGMVLADLRTASTPLILHTGVPTAGRTFNHWVVFLGMDGGGIRIYDPPSSSYVAASSDLLSCWDGRGIEISKPGATHAPFHLNMETLLGLGVVLAGGALVTQSAFLRARPLLALGLVVVSSTAIWHAIVDYGFINDHYGRATVASRYEQYNIPLMDIASLNTMIGQADVSIIDARRSKDYVREHLPNAVSVPVSATQGQLREALAAIPKSNRVVVYCQSNRCVWSDAIAQQLAANGYDNVWVYRDGMNGWRQKLDTADSQSQEDE